VDESATGSVNFCARLHWRPMRLPAFSHGVTSFLWAVGFAVFIWIGGIAVGFSGAFSFTIGAVAGAAIFLYVRTNGEDDPTRP